MPVYELADNETGKILSVEGDSPPTQADVAELFAAYGNQAYLPDADNDSYDLELAGETGKAVVRGFGKGLLSAVGGLSALANTVTDNIGLEELIDSGEENEVIRLANQGKKAIDESIGVGDEYRDRWLVGAAEGFGSIGSIFVGGGIGGLAGRAGGLSGAAFGAGAGSVITGAGLGTSNQQDRLAESRSRGIEVSSGKEDASNVLGAFIGSFEAFVPFKILGKMAFVGGTTAKKKFIEALGNAGARALEEGSQEVISGLLQDAVQKNIVAYDPDIEVGESLWDDFTMGGASAFTLDLLTNAFLKKRGSITKDAELEREAQFREEEEQQNTYFSDQAEQRKSQIEQERRKRRLDALNNKADELTQTQEAERAALQLEAENARYRFDPLMPYNENLNLKGTDLAASQVKALQAKNYASQIASAATRSGEGFPASGDFTVKEELNPEGTSFKVVHSETGQQYGQSSLEREDAIHLMSNLNDQIIRRSVNRGILDSIDETSENYSPEQAESLYFIGQKLNNPDRDTITGPMLNEAGGTTGPNYQENLSINSLHQSQHGVPPLTDRGEKIYKDLSNLTVAQKINLERVKKGLPEANEFSLVETKAALGKDFPKVFDLLSDAKSTETGTLGDFGSVGQELEQSRNKYQNDKQVKEDLLNILEKKNITSDINSPEVQYIFKRLVGEADISSMSTSQRAYLVKELSTRLPVLPQPATIPDFTPNPYTAEQYETALENSLSTGDGSVISIKEVLGDVGSDKRANVIATAINKKLLSNGLIDSEGVFQERLLLEAPKVVEEKAVSVDLEPYSESDPTSFPDITGIPDPIVFEKNFKKKLKSLGLEDVGLRVLGTLRDAPTTRDGTLIYEKGDDKKVGRTVAYYKPSVKTIFLGIDRSSQALSNQGQEVTPQALEDALAEVLDHEMVHAVRDLDLWTKKEWESLERLAKTKMFPGKDNITFFDEARGRYSELSPVGQMEEAVAELIRVGRKDKSLITGKPKSLIKKMFSFFEKLSNAIKGSGFNTLDQVFESTLGSLESGEIGARTRGEIRTLRATEKKMRALPDRGIGREADVIDLDDVELDPESINSEVEVVSAMNDKFSRTSPVRAKTPKRKIKAYKLFNIKGKDRSNLYPLFVDSNTPVETDVWVEAKAGEINPKTGKVKSSLGDLAFRPGWHSGDTPSAKHIGGISDKKYGGKKPDYRKANQVWAEVEVPNDFNWQSEANNRASVVKAGPRKGLLNVREAHITNEIPVDGNYRYKTNPNMEGNWIISGSMKVNKLLTPDQKKKVLEKNGIQDLPTLPEVIDQKGLSFDQLRKEAKKELQEYYPEKYKELTGVNFIRASKSLDRSFNQQLEPASKGINVATDGENNYADLIVTGQKKLETRDTDSLRPYVGKRVGIVETKKGQKAKLVGYATVGEPVVVNQKEFENLRDAHLVPSGSKFDIKEGQTKHLYEMINPEKLSRPLDASSTTGIRARDIKKVLEENILVSKGDSSVNDNIQVTYSEEFNANALAQEEIKSYREQSEALDKIIESIPESSITRGYAEDNEKFQDDIAAQQSGVKPLSFQSVSHTYGRLDKIIYNVADKFIGLKNIEDAINKGRKLVNLPSIETIDSAYAGEQSISGKAGNLFREFEETRKKPLAEKIAKSGLSREQVDEFITLRHAIERNNRIALRDPSRNPESMPGSGSLPTGEVLTNSFVKARMRDLYNLTWNDATQSWDGGNKRSKNLSSVVKDLDQIINETLDRSINGGLLSKEAADSIRSIYKYYAPLQGKNIEDDFAATINGVSGKSFSVKGGEVRGALGRQSAALSPVSNIISNAEKTITRSLNNKEFGQKLVSLIGNNPNPDFWEVYSPKNPRYKKNFSKKYIYIGLDPDLSKGNYKSIPPGMNKKDFIETIDFVPDRNTEDLIGVKIDGEQYYVDIKGDDRLREALIVSDSNSSNAIVGTLGKLNRFLSMVNTQLNPEFVVGNFVKDIQTAVFNIIGEQDMPGGKARNQKLVKKVLKDTIPSMGVFYKLLKSYNVKDGTFRGDLTGISAKDQADAKEFLEAGAKADWFYARQPEEQAQAIDNMVDMANGTFSGTFRKRYQGVMQFVENANSAVENAVRLATFKAARDSFLDSGIRREEAVAKAADLAKNLTVNFNRKGMQGDLLNSLYLFFNASVQGTRNFARGLFGPKGNPFSPEASRKKQGMVASLTLFSTLLAEMGEEESEINPETGRSFYSEIPDFIKERNIVIMADPSVKEGVNTSNTYIGKDGKEFDGSQRYYLIPLPYGYNVFSYLGQSISEIGRGNMSPLKAASNLTSAMMGSFSPVGISPIPTFAQPFFEISQNENFFGAPIYKDAAMFGGTGPDSALSMRSTPEAFKFLAETANILTQPGNGNKYEKGAVDISPDSLEHLFDFALGGAGQFGKRTKDLAEKILSGEEIAESREIPFVRRLMGESNDRGSQSDYYERRALLNNKKTAYLAMQGAERTSYKEGNEDYLKMLYSLKNIESRLKKLRTKRKDAEKFAASSPSHAKKFAEFEKKVFDYESELYNAFNKRYDEIVGRDK